MGSRRPEAQSAARGRVALVHDNFEGPTGMGRVLERHAHAALESGWEVTVVGSRIPDALRRACAVRSVRVHPRLPALAQHVAWCSAARPALRGLDVDLVHVHSPLLLGAADLITCHFIAAPAYARGVRETSAGVEGALRRVQEAATRRLDDRLYRRRPSHASFSFVSDFLRDEFLARYGPAKGGWVLAPPAPPWRPVEEAERASARARLGCDPTLVAGFLGGIDPRKGLRSMLVLQDDERIFPLVAGPGTETVALRRGRALGFVQTDDFLAACDVMVAPSAFDSAPVAVLQALARGIPVVVTPTTGWAKAIARHRAGHVWDGSGPLADAVVAASAVPAERCCRLLDDFSVESQRRALDDVYRELFRRPGPTGGAPPAS